MPTFGFSPWWTYILWNVLAFVVALVPHSIMEWMAHRFVLHSKVIVKFAYDEHDQNHHKVYLHDETFSKPGFDYGVDFHLRDWALFLVFVLPFWAGIEYLIQKPILLGATASACMWLQLFNFVHRHFHAPDGGWIEKTWFFRVIRRHHVEHHRDPRKNFNVAFLPIADFLLGTYSGGLKRSEKAEVLEVGASDGSRT